MWCQHGTRKGDSMITIRKYQPSAKITLADMMVPYMTELKCDVPEHIIRGKLSDLIDTLYEAGYIHIALAWNEGEPVGFSIYQIDKPESDWCKRPGWGFVREFYIEPKHRGKGFGAQLAAYTEEALKKLGAEKLYLTSGPGAAFWQRCGWKKTGEVCSNDLTILEKI